jgi:hypothetical protein
VGVDEVVAAGEDGCADRAGGFDVESGSLGGFEERGIAAGKEGGFDSLGRRQADPRRRWVPRPAPLMQALDEAEGLPLAATHRLAKVQVKDAHQLMFLALEYFRKV